MNIYHFFQNKYILKLSLTDFSYINLLIYVFFHVTKQKRYLRNNIKNTKMHQSIKALNFRVQNSRIELTVANQVFYLLSEEK